MNEQKDKLWNKNYLKVLMANTNIFFAFYLLTPLLPLYLSENFHAAADVIGYVLSGYTVTALLVRPFSGYFVDSFPRKKVLMISFAIFAVFFLGYIFATTFLVFGLARILHGGSFGAVTVANSTVAIDVLPSSRRNEGIGFYGLSNNIAMALAPTTGLFIYKYTHDFHLLFWVALLVAVIGIAIDQSVDIKIKPAAQKKKKLSFDRFFLVNGWLLFVNMAFFGICFGVLSYYLAIYSKEVLGNTGETGSFFALLSLGLIASRLQGSKQLRRGRLTHNAAEGIIFSTLGYLLFVAIKTEEAYFISALLIGLGNGHLWPAFQNMMISMAKHDERGTANSTILTSWDLGQGIGIVLGGVVAEYSSFIASFWCVAVIHIIGCAIFFVWTEKFFFKGRLS